MQAQEERYRFNSALWASVWKYLGVTPTDASNACGVCSRDTLLRSVRSGKVRMPVLVAMCNLYRLDIMQFFMSGSTCMSALGDLRVPPCEWTAVSYNPGALTGYSKKAECIYADQLAIALAARGISISAAISGGRICSPVHAGTNDAIGRVVYNGLLFQMLPVLLCTEQSRIGRASGHSDSTYANAVKCGDVTVGTLVDICNAWHIDISLFFCHGQDGVIPSVLRTNDNDWRDVRFVPERLRLTYMKDSPFGLDFSRLAELLGFTRQTLMRTLSHASPMRASALVHICNTLGVSPMMFFDGQRGSTETLVSIFLQKKVDSLEHELAKQAARCQAMQKLLNEHGIEYTEP